MLAGRFSRHSDNAYSFQSHSKNLTVISRNGGVFVIACSFFRLDSGMLTVTSLTLIVNIKSQWNIYSKGEVL